MKVDSQTMLSTEGTPKLMHARKSNQHNEAGFSLIELMVAMGVTLVVMGIASALIASTLRVRSRENRRTDALADTQRALNLMSREIGNAGFRMRTNGIVWQDSNDNQSIRVLANLNKYTGAADGGVTEEGEDVKYFVAANTKYLVRYDRNVADPLQTTVLANNISSLRVYFYDTDVNYTTGDCTTPITITTPGVAKLANDDIEDATYVVLAVCVDLPAEGKAGSPGYQPASQTLLVSDVSLRNNNLYTY